ncbi:ATP-dependent zinc metalloprotease FtsH [Eubacterium sp. AF34-35BH]|jgi:cell division protease FtsH|uniref:ATP-dependent zinc metalloprotease FtsH n=1 Tax=Eubacterium TaxID=1730 RepID=UPI000E497205|nr:ATP-dependent zinc metalloprotease FtsH [Eubacterium sp. AF34-35BH]RHP20901.1 ATP-dependent metallopeptidase FtsH/Yme1/Tma family protein [Eubacterium sp. AF34-35BH]
MDNNRNIPPRNNQGGPNNQKKNKIISVFVTFIVALIFTSLMSYMFDSATKKEITYNQFIDLLDQGQVEKVTFDANKIYIVPKTDGTTLIRTTFWTTKLDDPDLITDLKDKYAGVSFKAEASSASTSILYILLEGVLPLVFFWAMLMFIMRKTTGGKGGGGVFGVGKSNAKIYIQKETGVTFKDVAGQEEAKESVVEMVDFLHNPGKYTAIGAKLPKGALLVGPPGTGKTLLAKAVAGEAKVPFFSLSGSDFVEMFVGVGASRVRDLFKQAEENAPCIVFIDEIDSIGKSRDSRYGGGNDEREQTLNALLAEMDGFDSSKGILILAATNRPEVLDPALLRPGRFDRRVIVDTPDFKGRLETLKVHSKDVKLDETVDLDAIANITSGAVGSDLANMVNEAAINAVKCGRKAISQDDLMEAVEVVIAGREKKDRILSKEEKKIVSYHEVGHALVAAIQKHAEPVQKITIVPRTMGSLGYVIQAPEKEKYLMSKDELSAELVTLLAGRASEEIVFDSVTTGASNDMEKATKIARSMIAQYGMSEKFGLMSLEQISDPYLGGHSQLNCSDKTATEIEEEVKTLLKQKYEEAKKLLQENRDKLDKIAKFLYEKETITGKQFMDIYHKCDEPEASKETTQTVETVENARKEAVQPTEETVAKEETVQPAEETTTSEETTQTVETVENAKEDITEK